jgi:preprotein translocase subunit SecD
MGLSPGRVCLCTGTALLASGIVALGFYRNWFHLGIDLPPTELYGATALTFELDRARTKGTVDPVDLAAALKRRIDPADLHNITVRSPGADRVEIVLPTTADIRPGDIEDIKGLIAQQGKLEFRMLANTKDDADAIMWAKDWINDATNSKKLDDLNNRGEPPPPPLNGHSKPEFTITLGGEKHTHTYEWVQLGKGEVSSLGLQNSSTSPLKEEATGNSLGKPFTPSFYRFLLYSREIPEELRKKPERLAPADLALGKKYEFFILTRNSEPNKEVTGQFLTSAKRGVDENSHFAVEFAFDTMGADRFHEMTTLNTPEPGSYDYRQLAILLDDQIEAAPNVTTPMRGKVQITGNFTAKQVDDLVTILRAGALPAILKPQPINETTIEPVINSAHYKETILRRALWSVAITFVAVFLLMLVCLRIIKPTTPRTTSEDEGQEPKPARDGVSDSPASSEITGIQKG